MTEPASGRGGLAAQFKEIRAYSGRICAPLATEDYVVQPMEDASPPKWHLAHTTWFFETFVLKPLIDGYAQFSDQYEYLFNSYYESVGDRHPRPHRGNLSRPTLSEISAYRRHVDVAMEQAILSSNSSELTTRTVLGLHHEQQHQELLITDIKANLGTNPLKPPYLESKIQGETQLVPLRFAEFSGGLVEIGVDGDSERFCFDNETPRHKTWLENFRFANRLVTNREYLDFIEDGGYREPTLWLSDGWRECNNRRWVAPEYWRKVDGEWFEYTLNGEREVEWSAPVVHVSYYEADAYARWAHARLPTEFEWEHACANTPSNSAQDAQNPCFHPRAAPHRDGILQSDSDCWQWTASSYQPFPGFRPLSGALGEYNGKFMANQLVLRGGSCVTPPGHLRTTYRNFFYGKDRWQFTGIRLANDIE